MTNTAFASAEALGYCDYRPQVMVSFNGPKGGNRGTIGVTPDAARSLATQLITGAAEIDGKPCEIVRLAPFEIAALAAAVSFGDSFTTDWVENEGKSDRDAIKGAADVELAEQLVSRIEAAHGAIAANPVTAILAELQRRRDSWAAMSHTADGQDDLDEDEGEQLATEYDELLAFVRALVPPCNTADEPAPYEEEPEEARTGLYCVRFFMLTTTCDRHSIKVRASSPEAAKARVDAWRRDLIDLTHDEETTENLDKEMDVTDSTYDGLAEQPWDEPTELEAPEQLTEGAQGDPLAAQADA
jgi:hypothetical protein